MTEEYSMVLAENIADCSMDYDALSGSIKGLMVMHHELEAHAKAVGTPLHKAYAKLKRLIFKKPKHTVEEVMNMQIFAIKAICRDLSFQVKKTRKKFSAIVDYSEGADSRILESLAYISRVKPVLGDARKTLEEQKTGIEMRDKQSENYFSCEHELKHALRQYQEQQHQCDLATDAVIDLMQQRGYLASQEDVIRSTAYLSERLLEKAKRIESQMSLIKGMYDSVLRQHKSYIDLYRALSDQKAYIDNLDEILMEGRHTMSQIASRSVALNAFHENNRLESVVESMHLESDDSREERELMLIDCLVR